MAVEGEAVVEVKVLALEVGIAVQSCLLESFVVGRSRDHSRFHRGALYVRHPRSAAHYLPPNELLGLHPSPFHFPSACAEEE